MKKILTLLFLLFAVNAHAANFWVTTSGSDSNGCNASDTPLTTTAKRTPSGGLTCLSAGDTLNVRTGSYAGINNNTHTIASGTSWTNAVTISAYSGDTVTLGNSGSNDSVINLTSPTLKYVIFKDFRIDGENPTYSTPVGFQGITFASTVSFIKFENLTHVGNTGNACVSSNDPATNNLWFTGGIYSNCGSYGFYIEGPNNIVENLTIHDTGKNKNPLTTHAIHNFTNYAPFNTPSRNIYRNLRIYNGGGLLVWRGDQNQVYNNEIYDSNVCIDNGGSATNTVLYNITCYNPTTYAWNFSGSSGSIAKNLVHWGGSDTSFNFGSSSITQSHNACKVSGCTGTGATNGVNPNFTNAAGGDFTLTSGSPMIDSGIGTIGTCPPGSSCTYSTAFNGSTRDKGRFETIPFASASATDANTVDIQFGTAYAPLSTVSNCTGFTLRQAAATKTLATCTNPPGTNGIARLTCAACVSGGGGTIDFSITAGKFTDSTGLQGNFAITNQTVANNISGTTEVFTVLGVRQRTVARAVTDTIAPAWIKAENAPGSIRIDLGQYSGWFLIGCTAADCPPVGFQFEWDYEANFASTQTMPGTYANMTDSCLTNPTCFSSLNSAAPHGTVIPDCLLTNIHGNCGAGAVAAQASSYPVLDLSQNQARPIQINGAIKSGLTLGGRICIRPKLDSGAAITHNQTLCIDVVNPAGSPA